MSFAQSINARQYLLHLVWLQLHRLIEPPYCRNLSSLGHICCFVYLVSAIFIYCDVTVSASQKNRKRIQYGHRNLAPIKTKRPALFDQNPLRIE